MPYGSEATTALEDLSDADIGKLLLYAKRLIRASGLPESRYDHQDCVHRAFELFLDGTRQWNPDKVSLLPFLMGIVKSLISHQAEHDKNHWSELSSPNEIAGDSAWSTVGSVALGRKPESILIEEEIEANWIEEARKALVGDSAGNNVFDELLAGKSPGDICGKLDIDRKGLNVIKLRIRRKLRRAGLGEF